MAFQKKNTVVVTELPEQTLDQRREAQLRRAEAALSVFSHAAVELQIAADELDKVAEEASLIAYEHEAIADAALDAAERNRANAVKINNLFA